MKTISEKYGRGIDWKRIVFGVGIGIVTTMIMTAAGAWMLDREMVGIQWLRYLAALILLSASFVGTKSAGRGENRWITSGLVGAGYWLALLTVNALMFEGSLGGAGETALAILGGCGAAALLGGKPRSPRRRKYRNR